MLVHYRKDLRDYMSASEDDETKHHISVLLAYLEENLGSKILEEDSRYLKPTPVATFEMLWMLYKPGTDVYAQIDEQRGGFVVQSCEAVTENRKWGTPMPLKVLMWYLDYNGVSFNFLLFSCLVKTRSLQLVQKPRWNTAFLKSVAAVVNFRLAVFEVSNLYKSMKLTLGTDKSQQTRV